MHLKTARGATMFREPDAKINMDLTDDNKYAIWTGDGGYFAGVFGGEKSFRSDPMMATKYNTEHEAEEAALNEIRMDPQEFEIRQVQ